MEKQNCEECKRYVPNGAYDPDKILSARGYCRIPVRDTGGLLGPVEAGNTLNIIFARSRDRCDEGRKWFVPANTEVSVDDGPDFSDGHDCEGFIGGCERFGCPGGEQCTELTHNTTLTGAPETKEGR